MIGRNAWFAVPPVGGNALGFRTTVVDSLAEGHVHSHLGRCPRLRYIWLSANESRLLAIRSLRGLSLREIAPPPPYKTHSIAKRSNNAAFAARNATISTSSDERHSHV